MNEAQFLIRLGMRVPVSMTTGLQSPAIQNHNRGATEVYDKDLGGTVYVPKANISATV